MRYGTRSAEYYDYTTAYETINLTDKNVDLKKQTWPDLREGRPTGPRLPPGYGLLFPIK